MTGLPLKVRLLTAVVIVSNVLGNLVLSAGMKDSASWQVVFSPLVLLGVALLILWVLSRMTLLSWADLSYVLPVTSFGYVLSALAARFLLAESITPWRWAGTLLIIAGICVVGTTAPKTGER